VHQPESSATFEHELSTVSGLCAVQLSDDVRKHVVPLNNC
jgi:hypothetical protein